MPQSVLEKFIASLSGPRGPRNQGSDAPGSNARIDVNTPDQRGATPDSGIGVPDSLGYVQHGVAPLGATPEQARAAIEHSRARFPGLATHGRPGPIEPEFNEFYGQWRTREGYDRVITNTAHGTWVVGTTVTQTVTLDTPPNLRLSQYPGAIMVFPMLMLFSWSQSVLTATGQYSFGWILDGSDMVYPLGEYNAGTASDWKDPRMVIPAPITDPGKTTLGTLVINAAGVVGTPSINWRMGIGWAYLLPTPAYKHPIALDLSGNQQAPALAHGAHANEHVVRDS